MTSNSSLDPRAFYTKATRAEVAQEYDEAFRLYIKAAHGFLHLSRGSGDDAEKMQWNREAGKALERAERIKTVKGKSRLRGVEVDFWSDEEQAYVLQKSSIMNDLPIPLWADPLTPSISQSLRVQPPLSPAQIARSAIWSVPTSPFAKKKRQIEPHDIIQQVISDCSVCAAMSVCVAHQKRLWSKPDAKSNLTEENASGVPDLISISTSNDSSNDSYGSANDDQHYDLKVFFNGAWRRISIDSKLPMDSSSTILGMSVHSAHSNTEVLWPSLVEKAYMKLMGGYDFPGSNSSIDLHTLTGWIPEHIEIKSPSFSREKTWARILNGHLNGHCVLTLGTDKYVDTDSIFKLWGHRLLQEHNYAVIDIREVNDERLFTLLNSRIERELLEVDDDHLGSEPTSTFEMSWDEICNLFEGIYINWDPGLFQHHLQFHGIWKAKNTEDKELSSNRHLRLMVEPGGKIDSIWILLTRHQVSSKRKSEYIALHVQDQDEGHADITRIAAKATYTNSPHVLVRLQVSQNFEAISILASYDGPFEEVGYTVKVYSTASISWDKFIPKPPFTQKEVGTLTSKNAGGNCTYPTFMVNPQYHLRIHPDTGQAASGSNNGRAGLKANVVLNCQASRETPLNVTLVWSQGERITELAQNEVALSSGAYSYRLVRATQILPVGDYTVIVSAFEPRHIGPFVLRVECSHHIELKPIPQEGAGTYHKVIHGAWDTQTAAGGPDFKRYFYNPAYEVTLSAVTQLKLRLQLLQPSSSVSLNLTLFHMSSDSKSIGKHIVTSGPYSDGISGVVTPQVSLNQGTYLLVPSTYHPSIQVGFRLIAYCSAANVNITLRTPRTG